MNPTLLWPSPHRILLTLAVTLAAIATAPRMTAADSGSEFSKPVIDIGIVVADIGKSAGFYTNVIGFKEVPGFKVAGDRAGELGLTDNQPADIRVFVLGDGNQATRVKLMSFPAAPGQKSDQRFVHSTLGFSYLTLYVSDMNAALARLEKAKVKTLGKTPLDLGGGTWIVVCKDPDGNFLELVGPKGGAPR